MKRGFSLALLFFLVNTRIVSASNETLLKSRHFTPEPGITAAAKAKIEAIGERAHVFLQLKRIPTVKGRKELESKGIRLLSYIPNRAWFASIPSDKAGEILSLSNVRAISEISPEDKIAPSIRKGGVSDFSTTETGQAKLIFVFFDDVPLADTAEVISNHGGTVIDACPITTTLVVHLPKEVIYELAEQDCVQWINQHYEAGLLNDGARAAVNVDELQVPSYGLTGIDVKVGQWDGGCPDANHEDLTNRVICADGSAIDEHATHVAGTIAGNGNLSGGTYRGMATNATIVSYNHWLNAPNCYSDYEHAISNYDIDLSNNSWGMFYNCGWPDYNTPGEYDENAAAEDDVVISACGKKISLIFASGNEGNKSIFSCSFPWRTLRRNAVAKNIIAMGATNSDDDSLAPFSSRGPTADGRIKPDLVAPGCDGSCIGQRRPPEDPCDPNEYIWSTWPGDTYDGMNGASCATPVVSGSVALMLEDWRNNHTGDPLPSTIKAILIQTAVDLGNTGPDYSSGYGKINAKDAIDLITVDVNNNVIVEDSIIDINDKDYFTIDVPEGQSILKITLVWDDYKGTVNADIALINDLDLIVKDPNSIRYYPWTLDPCNPGDSAVRNQEDHINNVEQVCLDNPASGIWLIEITDYNLPVPAQIYSLVSNITLTPISLADFNDDSVVNFFDYALFANAWLTDSNTLYYDEKFDLVDSNFIDYNDLALFYKNWLWPDSQTIMMGFGGGSSFGESVYSSSIPEQAEQQQSQETAQLYSELVEPIDIEKLLKWLDELWLDPEVRQGIDEDAWLEFVESVESEL